MELQSQTDHIAILSLMLVGTLIKRLDEVGHLDDKTARRIHQLVGGVRLHAENHGIADLKILFDNIDRTLQERAPD